MNGHLRPIVAVTWWLWLLAAACTSTVEPASEPLPHGDTAETRLPAEDGAAAVDVAVPGEGLVRWPDPPRDHDPNVIVRPALHEHHWPAAVDATAFVYVNSIGRPTVVDVATGDQYEVDIAESRIVDRVLVEDGGIVIDPYVTESRSQLPDATDAAVVFAVLDGVSAEGLSAPVLCVAILCADRPGTTGRVIGPVTIAESIGPPGSATEILVELFDARGIDDDGRFLTLGNTESSVRLPTPGPRAVLWALSPVG